MSKVTLRQLEYFRAIAATGSMTAASEQEHVSRSTIAGALDDLERALATQLCVRHKSQGILLTPAGSAVLDTTMTILSQIEDLEDLANSNQLTGVLSVGCFTSLAPTILPKLIRQLAGAHPGVDVHVEAKSTDALIELVRAGQLDVIISYKLHTDVGLSSRELYATRMHAVLPADHHLAAQEVVDIYDVVDEPMVLMATPPSQQDIGEYFSMLGILPNVKYRTDDFELGRSLIAAGLGFGLFIQRPRHDLTYDGLSLATRPISPVPPLERVSIAWPRGRMLTSKAAAFVDLALASSRRISPQSLYEDDGL